MGKKYLNWFSIKFKEATLMSLFNFKNSSGDMKKMLLNCSTKYLFNQSKLLNLINVINLIKKNWN